MRSGGERGGRVPARCREVREALQDFHDRRMAPEGPAALHLAGCPRCAAFQDFLARLGADARQAVESPLAGLPAPDAEAARRRADTRRAPAPLRIPRLALLGTAAACVIAIAAGGGLLAYGGYRERLALRVTVSDFVDELFVSPALEGAEYWAATGGQDLDGLLAEVGAGFEPDGP